MYEYTVSAVKLEIDVPTYTHYPTQSTVAYTYAVKNSDPSFVKIEGTQIVIHTTSGADSDEYTVVITTTETYSGLNDDVEFKLLVKCVQSITWEDSVEAVTYYIFDPSKEVTLPRHALTPADCPYELEYSAKLSSNTALPNAITLHKDGD